MKLETPNGQKLTLGIWRHMPYLTADQVATVMAALPPPQSRGRSGKPAGDRVAAAGVVLGPRACAARATQIAASASEPPSTQHCPGEESGREAGASLSRSGDPLLTPAQLQKRLAREALNHQLDHVRPGVSKDGVATHASKVPRPVR